MVHLLCSRSIAQGSLLLLLTLLISFASAPTLVAQTDTVPAKHWYDTLKVTKPRYAYKSNYEKLALSAFAALALPVSLTVGAFTLFPPSINFLVEDGRLHTGVVTSTGVGFGGDSTLFAWFPDYRIQLEIGYYFGRARTTLLRAGLLHDFTFRSIHPRDFFFLAAAAGGGIATDFDATSLYGEGWFGIANPNGIRFITLFPMHNYGLRLRAGYDFTAHRPWYEVGLAATATF
jgi:hypothetical protein